MHNRQLIRSSLQSPPTQLQDSDEPIHESVVESADEPVGDFSVVPETHRQPSSHVTKLPERFKDCIIYQRKDAQGSNFMRYDLDGKYSTVGFYIMINSWRLTPFES